MYFSVYKLNITRYLNLSIIFIFEGYAITEHQRYLNGSGDWDRGLSSFINWLPGFNFFVIGIFIDLYVINENINWGEE